MATHDMFPAEEDAEDIRDVLRAMADPRPSIPHSEVLARYATELAEYDAKEDDDGPV